MILTQSFVVRVDVLYKRYITLLQYSESRVLSVQT